MAVTSQTKMLVYKRADDRALIPLVSPTTDLGANSTSSVTGISIGFTFTFDGVAYTTCALFAFGYLRLAGTMNSNLNLNLFTAHTSVILAPWWDALETADTVGYLKHETQGTAPWRRFVVEWYANMQSGQTATDYDRAKFQVVLYETSNRLEYRYGTMETAGAPSRVPYSASIGYKGNTSVSGTNYRDFAVDNLDLGASSSTSTINLSAYTQWPALTYASEPNWPMCDRYVYVGEQMLSGLQNAYADPLWAFANNVNWLYCNFRPPLVDWSPRNGTAGNLNFVTPILPSVDGLTYRVYLETYSPVGGTLTCDVGRDNTANPQAATNAHWTLLATGTETATPAGYRSWTSFTIVVPSTALYLRFHFGATSLALHSVLVVPDAITDFDPTAALPSAFQWMGIGQIRQEGAAIHPEFLNRCWRDAYRVTNDRKQMLWAYGTPDVSDYDLASYPTQPVRMLGVSACAMPAGFAGSTATLAIYAYDTVNGGKLTFAERGGNVATPFTVNSNTSTYRGQTGTLVLQSDQPTIVLNADPAGFLRTAFAGLFWSVPFTNADLIAGATPVPRIEYLFSLNARILRACLSCYVMTGLATVLTQGSSGKRVMSWMVPPATKALRALVMRNSGASGAALATIIYGASSGAGAADEIDLPFPMDAGTDQYPPDGGQNQLTACTSEYNATPAAASARLLESPTLALITGPVRERVEVTYGVGVTLVPIAVDPSTL